MFDKRSIKKTSPRHGRETTGEYRFSLSRYFAQMPAVLRLTRRARANAAAGLLLALAVLTCALPPLLLIKLSRPPGGAACRAIPAARRALLAAVLSFPRSATPLADPRAPDALALDAAERSRAASARLQALVGVCGAESSKATLPLSPTERNALEFATLSRYPVDGVLQYVLGLIGVRSKMLVELDGAPRAGVFRGSAALVMYNGFSALVVHALWSGFNQAQQYYEGGEGLGVAESAAAFRKAHFPDAALRLDEADLAATNVDQVIRQNAFGGDVDIVFAVLDGAEYAIWEKVSAVVPRLVVFFYQDYWGADVRVSRSANSSLHIARGQADAVDTGRRRLFVGASLAALVDVGMRRGYSLAWCLRSVPIAIFVYGEEQLLPRISTTKCLAARKSKTWRRDMEAQWHAAQKFSWTKV